jgi:hypothetical protein
MHRHSLTRSGLRALSDLGPDRVSKWAFILLWIYGFKLHVTIPFSRSPQGQLLQSEP